MFRSSGFRDLDLSQGLGFRLSLGFRIPRFRDLLYLGASTTGEYGVRDLGSRFL